MYCCYYWCIYLQSALINLAAGHSDADLASRVLEINRIGIRRECHLCTCSHVNAESFLNTQDVPIMEYVSVLLQCQ